MTMLVNMNLKNDIRNLASEYYFFSNQNAKEEAENYNCDCASHEDIMGYFNECLEEFQKWEDEYEED